MKRSLLLFAVFWAGLEAIHLASGYDAAYDTGYGAIALAALVIAATFAWLWRIRATPMALGMAVSWSGCSGLVGYWWVFHQLGRMPRPGLEQHLLWVILALYLAGAVAHLRVISRACGGSTAWYVTGCVGVVAASLGVALLVS